MKNLEQIRMEMGLSQATLARRAGLSEKTVRRMEQASGQTTHAFQRISVVKLMGALTVSPEERMELFDLLSPPIIPK